MSAIQLRKLARRIEKIGRQFEVADRLGMDKEVLKRRSVNLTQVFMQNRECERGAE